MIEPAASTRRRAGTSLRVKLTAWFVVIFALIQGVGAVLVVVYLRQQILSSFDERLTTRAREVIETIRQIGPPWHAEQLQALALNEERRVFIDRAIIDLFDDSGRPLASSWDEAKSPIPPVDHEWLRTHPFNPRLATVDLEDESERGGPIGGSYRTLSIAFDNQHGERFLFRMATRTSHLEESLTYTSGVMMVVFPLGLLAALVAGWFIVGLATNPLQRLTEEASHLSPAQIGARIESRPSASEFASLQEELNRALDRIERGYRAQERFISTVSHELKTPIAVLLTEAQTLGAEAQASEGVARFVRSVEEEMRQLGRLIESFLTLARVEQGGVLTRPERCDLNDIVIDSIRECSRHAELYRVELTPILYDAPGDGGAIVHGDCILLRTMFDNLIRNAVRFSPARARVDVTVDVDESADSVRIDVRDRGPGIPPDMIKRIFDRFVQAAPEHSRGRGHGLGLSIAGGIAELHGGHIRAANCPDGGCVFSVFIPRSTETGGAACGVGPARSTT
jgi:two-component system OmpR family sensor kinase